MLIFVQILVRVYIYIGLFQVFCVDYLFAIDIFATTIGVIINNRINTTRLQILAELQIVIKFGDQSESPGSR